MLERAILLYRYLGPLAVLAVIAFGMLGWRMPVVVAASFLLAYFWGRAYDTTTSKAPVEKEAEPVVGSTEPTTG